MRVSVQGCLILLLCFWATSAHAANDSHLPCLSDVLTECQNWSGYPNATCRVASGLTHEGFKYVEFHHYAEGWKFFGSGKECACEDQWSHEGTDKTECGSCDVAGGWFQAPGAYAPDSGTEYAQPHQCVKNREPGECSDLGKAEVISEQGAFCVTECEHGMFNGACLPPPEPETECNQDSPDYRGELVLGYGQPPIPACGDFDQCSGDTPGQVGLVNGELRCIPENYGVPECKGDSITVIDEYGFVCEPLSNQPEEPETPEEPNTDTDGDGQPDEYNPDNDPNIHRKQLDDLTEQQRQANDSLENLEKLGKGTNSRLDDIKQNTRDTADRLQEIQDGMEVPEGGFSLDKLKNVVPTLTDTANNFKAAVMGTDIVQSVSGLTQIPSQTSCPVWTIPATDYWEAMPMNIHCDILEQYRGTFSVIFLFFWTGIAIFTFLRA